MENIENINVIFHNIVSKHAGKRISALKYLMSVCVREKTEKIGKEISAFLEYFLDDHPDVMLAVIQEIEAVIDRLGDQETQKDILALLLKFCGLDEREVALKALKLITDIVDKDERLSIETVEKLVKTNMVLSKECGILLLIKVMSKYKKMQPDLLSLYSQVLHSAEPSHRVMACKHLEQIAFNVTKRDLIIPFIDQIFEDEDELPRLFSVKPLLLVYQTSPLYALEKIKLLFSDRKWRMAICLCEHSEFFQKVLKTFHFKSTVEPAFFEMINSEDNQVRAASCNCLISLAKSMSHDEAFSKLFPLVQKLAKDQTLIVRIQLSKVIIRLIPEFPKQKFTELTPIVIELLSQQNQQIWEFISGSLGSVSNQNQIASLKQQILKLVLTPLKQDENSKNIVLKLHLIEIFSDSLINQSQKVAQLLMNRLKCRIDIVQRKSRQMLVKMASSHIFSSIAELIQDSSYRVRQQSIHIINLAYRQANEDSRLQFADALLLLLKDKVPNIRFLALKCISINMSPVGKKFHLPILQLCSDSDYEVRQAANSIQL